MGLLRLWLALCVVWLHSGPLWGLRFMEGGDAVATFFVLAGFFAAFMIDTRYRGRYRVFYLNRLLRVWPLYLLALLLTVALLAASLKAGSAPLGPAAVLPHVAKLPAAPWSWAWGFSQLFLAGQDALFFGHLDPDGAISFGCGHVGGILLMHLNLLPQAWSLALEEYFYLLAPYLARLNLTLSAAVLAAWTLAYPVLTRLCDDRASLRFFPVTVAVFVAGIFSYRCYQAWKARPLQMARYRPWVIAAYALFVVSDGYHHAATPWVVLAAALSIPMLFDAFQDRRWDRWLGDLSYPVYLFHYIVLWAVTWLWLPTHGGQSPCPLVIAITLAVAVLVSWSIETPLRKLRARLSEQRA